MYHIASGTRRKRDHQVAALALKSLTLEAEEDMLGGKNACVTSTTGVEHVVVGNSAVRIISIRVMSAVEVWREMTSGPARSHYEVPSHSLLAGSMPPHSS